MDPIRIARNLTRVSDLDEGDPRPFGECVQTILPVDGRATIPFEVPDIYGHPWAQIWEKHWEQGMEMPQQADIFEFE